MSRIFNLQSLCWLTSRLPRGLLAFFLFFFWTESLVTPRCHMGSRCELLLMERACAWRRCTSRLGTVSKSTETPAKWNKTLVDEHGFKWCHPTIAFFSFHTLSHHPRRLKKLSRLTVFQCTRVLKYNGNMFVRRNFPPLDDGPSVGPSARVGQMRLCFRQGGSARFLGRRRIPAAPPSG